MSYVGFFSSVFFACAQICSIRVILYERILYEALERKIYVQSAKVSNHRKKKPEKTGWAASVQFIH